MRISVDGLVVQDLLRKSNRLIEEARESLDSLNQAVAAAEMSGWNDASYYKFRDNFTMAKRQIEDGLALLEEVAVPELRRILANIDNFR